MRRSRFLVPAIVFVGSFVAITAQLALVKILETNIHNEIVSFVGVLAFHFFALAMAARRHGSQAISKFQLWLLLVTPLMAGLCLWVPSLASLHFFTDTAAPFVGDFRTHLIVLPFVFVASYILGFLHGTELPLVLKKSEADFGSSLRFAYFGALVAYVVIPLWLLPRLGIIGIVALATAFYAVNFALALLLERKDAWITLLPGLLVSGGLIALHQLEPTRLSLLYSDGLETAAGRDYSSWWEAARWLHSRVTVRTWESPFQRIDWVTYHNDVGPSYRLYLNGEFQFDSLTEASYHDGFFQFLGSDDRKEVLVIGAGDGLLAREILRRWPLVERIVLVELDPVVLELATGLEPLVKMNINSLKDRKVEVFTEDAFTFVARCGGRFDSVFVDLPHPSSYVLSRVYSKEFYTRLLRCLKGPGGTLVMDAPIHGDTGGILQSTLSVSGFTDIHPYGEGNTFIYAKTKSDDGTGAPATPPARVNTLLNPQFPLLE